MTAKSILMCLGGRAPLAPTPLAMPLLYTSLTFLCVMLLLLSEVLHLSK